MRSINLHQVRGNVGSIDYRMTSDETPVINFSIATNDRWSDKTTGEIHERTDWHRVAAFGKTAAQIHTIAKVGDYVFVSGPVKRSSYTSKEGATIPTAEIRLTGQFSDFQLIARKGERATPQEAAAPQEEAAAAPAPVAEDDAGVPF